MRAPQGDGDRQAGQGQAEPLGVEELALFELLQGGIELGVAQAQAAAKGAAGGRLAVARVAEDLLQDEEGVGQSA